MGVYPLSECSAQSVPLRDGVLVVVVGGVKGRLKESTSHWWQGKGVTNEILVRTYKPKGR